MESSEKKPKKTRKRRLLTEEQKAAAAERLAVAREKKAAENPPEYKSISNDVLALDDEHPWSHKKVRGYIKHQKKYLNDYKKQYKTGNNKMLAKIYSTQGYINNMESYLRNGEWVDLFWGMERENRVYQVCYAYAYDKDGIVKRDKNTYYRDIGQVYKEIC